MATLVLEQLDAVTDLFMAWERNIYRANSITRAAARSQILAVIESHTQPANANLSEFVTLILEGEPNIVANLTAEVIRTAIEIPSLPPELVAAAEDPNRGILGALWEKISLFFSVAFANVWTGFISIWPGVIRAVRGAFGFLPPEEYTSSFDNMLNNMVTAGVIDKQGAAWIQGILADSKAKGGMLTLAMTLGLALKTIGMVGDIAGGDFYKLAAAEFSPAVPSVDQLLKPMLLAPEKAAKITELMRQNGFSEEDVNILKINAYQMFNAQEIRELYFRKIIDSAMADSYLAKIGLTGERIEQIKQTWKVIPPIQDIMFMVAKEAFEDDIATATGLDDEFPTDQIEWGEKQGLSIEWMKKYWRAHWTAPSLRMGFEMFHRDVIDEKQLDFLFRIQEIPSFWRDKLLQISFNPYTRVDSRRMHKAGVLTDEDLYRAYRDIGYNDERAGKMVQWTIAYNSGSEKGISKDEISRGYRDGVINRTEAASLLSDLGYTPTQIDFYLDLVELRATTDLVEKETNLLERQFKNHGISETQARSALSALDYSSSKIQFMLREWTIDIELGERLPSKADLDKFYKAEIIGEAQYRDFMRRLDYSPSTIDLYMALLGT